MDSRTGEIMEKQTLRRAMGGKAYLEYGREVDPANLSAARQQQLAATGRTKVGRNESCPCGSGKKFKKCCLAEDVR